VVVTGERACDFQAEERLKKEAEERSSARVFEAEEHSSAWVLRPKNALWADF